jgi:ribosomal protein S8
MILDPITIKKEGFLGRLGATETKLKKRDVPYMIDWKGNLTEEQIKEIKELQAILDDKVSIHKEFQLFRELAGDLSVLVLRTEMGTPLEGRCSLCPNVKILEKGDKHE